MILAASDGAYIVVGVAVPLFGFAGVLATVLLQNRSNRARIEEIHAEVKSPNGTRSGDLTYESAKRIIELREQMVEVRESQAAHWRQWAESSGRLEAKVDRIADTQAEHVELDDARFARIYLQLGVDPE